jgi:DNA polymerase III subunit gamma/tau
MSEVIEGRQISLYRKYRPRSWDEVSGQESVIRVLKNTILRSAASHAYLFCGPRGTGKTSSARIFAAALNCMQPQDGGPCFKCSHCLAFGAGRYPDFVELDAASSRRIDDFREIRDQVQYPPLEGSDYFKVFVIDEAHMLTKEAANAFLKTLEEPPPYMVFILATTEPEKLLPTLISRCLRLDFELLNPGQVRQRLQVVLEGEGLHLESGVLDKLIQRGLGGMRNVLTALEQLVQFCGQEVTLSKYLTMMGLVSIETVDELLRSYSEADALSLVQTYKRFMSEGKAPEALFLQLLERVQNYLYFLLQVPGDYPPVPDTLSQKKLSYWIRCYKALLSSLDAMRLSLHPELHGEIALLYHSQHGSDESTVQDSGLGDRLKKLEKRFLVMEKSGPSKLSGKPAIEFKDQTLDVYPEAEKNWILILKELKVRDPMLHALLDKVIPREKDGVFSLYFRFEFHYNKVRDPASQKLLAELVVQRYGSKQKIELVLGIPSELEDRAPAIKKPHKNVERKDGNDYISDDLRQKLMRDQGLKSLVDELGAVIKNVD